MNFGQKRDVSYDKAPFLKLVAHARRPDWTEMLFVRRPGLFLPFLEEMKDRGEIEAKAVARLFRRSGVPPGSRILDLCCGIGRHAVPLASLGYRVVGLDLSERFLGMARRDAKRRHVEDRTTFVLGDVRELRRDLDPLGSFDGVLNGFTSIGYYGRPADRAAWRTVARHVRPGGVLVLWAANREWVLHHFQAHGWESAEDVVLMEERTFDRRRSHMVNRWEFFRRRGKVLRSDGVFRVDHRIYGPADLRDLLASAGWHVRSVRANFRGDRIDVRRREHGRMVAVATRPSRVTQE